MKKFLLLRNILILSSLLTLCFSQMVSPVAALEAEQKALYDQSILYYDLGCAPGTTSTGDDGVSVSGETTDPPEAVQQVVWDTLTGGGIDEVHTAAVMGKFDQEGAWDPMNAGYAPNNIRSKDPLSPKAEAEGYGLMGWTPGSFLTESMKDADITGKPYTAETQAAVVLAHIQGKTSLYPKSVGEEFLAKNTIEDATVFFLGGPGYGFERPADSGPAEQAQRIAKAKKFIRKFGGSSLVGGGGAQSSVGDNCICPAGGSATDSSLVGSDNAEKVFNFYVTNGYTPEQAAGFVGNYEQESGIDPTVENGIGAFGIAQWLGGRKTALQEFASDPEINPFGKEMPVDSLLVQLEFSLYELDGSEGAAKSAIKGVSGSGIPAVEEVTVVIRTDYERPGESEANDPNRIATAKVAYNQFGGGEGGGGAVSVSQGAASTGNCECSVDLVASNLSARLEELSRENGGKTQISVSSINGQIKGNAGGKVQMPTRSSYKIYTAYATLKAIEDRKISWSTRTSWGESVEATMEAMIIQSNNDAAEALRTDGRIGSHTHVTNLLQNEVGLSDKTVMGSGSASDPRGSNSQSTANDFTKFLIALEKGKLPGVKKEGNYNKLISFMKKATTDGGSARAGIAAGVGGDTEVADKPGWNPVGVDLASNDVGIVYLKGAPYVVSILTDKPAQWDGVAKIAKEVHSMMGGGSPGDGDGCTGAVPGDLTATVKAYAWPNYSASRDDPKPEYREAFDKASAAGQYPGGGYTDCGAFVTRVMIDSGFEPNYNYSGKLSDGAGNTINQQNWLDDNWQKVSVSSTKDLQPGDVAVHSSHTYMYVGVLPGFHGNSASASLGGRVPMASDYYEDGFSWYRKK